MCRQCLVEVDTGRGPQLMVSCMFPVAPDMKVETESPIAKAAQEGVLELLLANHPLDCPVCDKGGECPLQDQAFTPRSGREPLHRGEAPLREADPDQRPRVPRPRALRAVRSLHPLRRRGGRRRADPLHPSRQPDADQHVPRRAVLQLLQRQHRADLPGGRAHRQAVPVQGPPVGPRTRPRARAPPARSAAARRCSRAATNSCATRASTPIPSTGAGCATAAGSTSKAIDNDDCVSRRRWCSPPTAIAPTSWNSAVASAAQLHQRRDRGRRSDQRRRARRRTWHQRGRVRMGPARPRRDRHAQRLCTTRRRTAGRGARRSNRATIDEAGNADDDHPARSRSQRRAAGAVPAPARRGVEGKRTQDHRVRAEGIRPHAATRGGRRTTSRARRPTPSRLRSTRATSPTRSPRATWSSSSAGPTSPSRRPPPSPRCSRSRRHCPTRRCCPRCAAATSSARLQVGLRPGDGRPRQQGHPRRRRRTARSSASCCSAADPLSDVPDADLARRALAGARRIIAVDTFLTESSKLAHVVLPAASLRPRRSGTTTNLEGRVTGVAQKVTVAGTSRPDWMIAAELAAGVRHRPRLRHGVDESPLPSARTSTATRGSRIAALDANTERHRRLQPAHRSDQRTDGHPRRPQRLRLPPRRQPQAVRRRCRHAMSPTLAPLALGNAVYVNPLDVVRIGADGRRRRQGHQRQGQRHPSPRRRRSGAARHGVGAVQPTVDGRAAGEDRRPHRLLAPLSPTSGSRPSDARHRSTPRGHRSHQRPHRAAEGRRSSSSSVSSSRCSWCGSSARSSPACRTASGRTRPARSGCCRRWPTASSCSSRKTCCPNRADRVVFRLAPFLAFVPAFLVWSIIPLGGDFSDGNHGVIHIFGRDTLAQLADPPIGVLLLLALSGIAVYGIMLAGWSSGSKYPLLGSVRASAQMVSLRSGARPQHRRRAARHRHAEHERHRQRAEPHQQVVPHRHRRRAVRDLHDRCHGRAQPATVRPRRSRARARRRLQHRVLVLAVRTVLPRRVHEHGDDERGDRHALLRRTAATEVRDRRHRASTATCHLGPLSAARCGSSPRCSCSCTSTCGSVPRCPACATTS